MLGNDENQKNHAGFGATYSLNTRMQIHPDNRYFLSHHPWDCSQSADRETIEDWIHGLSQFRYQSYVHHQSVSAIKPPRLTLIPFTGGRGKSGQASARASRCLYIIQRTQTQNVFSTFAVFYARKFEIPWVKHFFTPPYTALQCKSSRGNTVAELVAQ